MTDVSVEQLRILLVEDSEHDAVAFRRALDRSVLEFAVIHCDRAEAALELLGTDGAFDLVVTDFKLPGMSGLELCTTLLEDGAPWPLVIMTGGGSEGLAVEALRLGVADYVVKDDGRTYLEMLPFVVQQVIQGYRDALARTQAEEALRDANANLERQVQERTKELETVVRQREQALEALRGSEARYRGLVDNAPLGIVACDHEGRILAINERMIELGAAPTGEQLQTINLLTDPALVDAGVSAVVRHCLDTGESHVNDFSWTTQWERTVYFRIHVGPMRSGSAKVTGVHAVVEDISERKRMEAERDLLAAALEQTVEAVMITDVNGEIEYVNPAFTRITGYTREEVLGRTPRLLKSGVHLEHFYKNLWETLLQGEVWTGRLTNRHRDGQLFHEEGAISPVRNAAGAIVRFVKVSRDVTEEIARKEQDARSQKMEAVGALAAGIAHEINTPIQFVGDNVRFIEQAFSDVAGVLAAYDALKRICREQSLVPEAIAAVEAAEGIADVAYLLEDVPQAVAQTMEGVERVATIVRAMREFSHPSVGEKLQADLNKALETTVTVARNELKYAADVQLCLAPDLPPVECDLGELNQVFLNLLINAAHAIKDALADSSDERGVITVRTRADNGEVEVSISDTGTGIPAAIRDRILDPFFTTKEVGKGTGQGLALAHTVVVNNHGGSLTFDTAEGKGTTFFVRLPIKASKDADDE